MIRQYRSSPEIGFDKDRDSYFEWHSNIAINLVHVTSVRKYAELKDDPAIVVSVLGGATEHIINVDYDTFVRDWEFALLASA
jgi:hypothetical protein